MQRVYAIPELVDFFDQFSSSAGLGVGSINFDIHLSNVDFPEPLSPIITSISPVLTSIDASLTAGI